MVWRFWSLANEDFEATKQVKPSFSSQNRHTLISLYRRYEGANFAHTKVPEGTKVPWYEGTNVVYLRTKVRRYYELFRDFEAENFQ